MWQACLVSCSRCGQSIAMTVTSVSCDLITIASGWAHVWGNETTADFGIAHLSPKSMPAWVMLFGPSILEPYIGDNLLLTRY